MVQTSCVAFAQVVEQLALKQTSLLVLVIISVVFNGLTVRSRQQLLSNLLHEKNFVKALGIAISLDQPHTVLRVIKGTFIDHYIPRSPFKPRVVLSRPHLFELLP